MAVQTFVNRIRELAALQRWWERSEQAAVVWGRRRVGKTALLQHFAQDKPLVFHTGADRGERDELRLVASLAAASLQGGLRDLGQRPYTSWDDALDDLAERAVDRPTLLVLDEFPELVASSPSLPGTLRAFLDRSRGRTQLRLLVCGSAVRHMHALQDEREPLYGRFDLALQVHPFDEHEAALLLGRLTAADRALVYGIVGGMPLYLSWWDQGAAIEENLERLVGEPGARLLTEGDLVLRTDLESGDYAQQTLYAIASGRTQYGEIKAYLRAEPQRTLDRLAELRLIERTLPVGESERSRRRVYRIVDPFLRFHLGVAGRYRSEIERGLGHSIIPILRAAIDDHMGDVWEEAFRSELRRRAAAGQLPVEDHVVAVGRWWDANSENEIDALALAGRSSTPVMAGEAKWASSVDAATLVGVLQRKVERGLRADPDSLRYAVCARTLVHNAGSAAVVLTAEDLFAAP
ncbi:MAG: ATP-binding protein [Candidatus Dormiibacterota bacterium]